MSNAFMAAYERAEERNDIRHGWFRDKKEERDYKRRNRRIAGAAAVGAAALVGGVTGGAIAYKRKLGARINRTGDDISQLRDDINASKTRLASEEAARQNEIDQKVRAWEARGRGHG